MNVFNFNLAVIVTVCDNQNIMRLPLPWTLYMMILCRAVRQNVWQVEIVM